MTGKADSEVKAMDAAFGALSGLEPDEQKRALVWLIDKLKLSGAVSIGAPAAGASTVHQQSGVAAGTGSGAGLTPKQFMGQKKPKTDAERITCLAYFMTHQRETQQFKTKGLVELNKEAAGSPFSNAAVAVNNASRDHYLAPAGGGLKQITLRGEAVVEALPDREKLQVALEENPARRKKLPKAKHRK